MSYVQNFSKKNKQILLSDIYRDLHIFLQTTFPTEYGKHEADEYSPISSNLVDAYKNIIHILVMQKIANFKNLDDIKPSDAVLKISKAFNLPDDYLSITQTLDALNGIVDKHLHTTGRERL